VLESLRVKGLGPFTGPKADRLETTVGFGSRLNLITGCNGLGKSFLLDLVWRALTSTWSGPVIRPLLRTIQANEEATFAFKTNSIRALRDPTKHAGQEEHKFKYVPRDYAWREVSWKKSKETPLKLVIYARQNGSFAVWDSVRNEPERFYNLSEEAVLFGLTEKVGERELKISLGMVWDLVMWQLEKNAKHHAFLRALSTLSAGQLICGESFARVGLSEAREYPTFKKANGEEVALTFASASERRLITLAYMLVWAWSEHRSRAEALGIKDNPQVSFIVDGIETYLDPQWQAARSFEALSSVLGVVCGSKVNAQLFFSTCSGAVLDSVRPYFEPSKDRWLSLSVSQLTGATKVETHEVPYALPSAEGVPKAADQSGDPDERSRKRKARR
jgi:hypothetical protein